MRGAISGTLKKKLGLAVTSEPIEKRGVSIVSPSEADPEGREEGGSHEHI